MKYSSSCLIYYTKYCAQTQKKCPKRQLHPNSSTVLEKSCNKFEWNYMTFRDSQNAKRNGILIIMHWIFIYLTTNFHSCLNTYLRAYDNFFLAFSNNIMAKLTNQCTQSGQSTFNWQQPFTWLWRWLPLRLSKRQSPLPTTVLLRTTLTWTIKLHYYMIS